MAEFTYYNKTYFRNEDGKLIPVTDPDTLKALKADQLPHKVEPMGSSVSLSNRDLPIGQVKGTQASASPSPFAVAGGGIEPPASTSLPGQGDMKSTFNSLLQKALKSFAGASNVEELRARKDSLIARQMVAPTSAPGMETRPDFGTKLISDRGAEFGGALDILDTEIGKAKQGDADTISKLNSLMSIGEKLGLIGDKTKAADVKEIDGQLVERQSDGSWKVVFGTKKLSAEQEKKAETETQASQQATLALGNLNNLLSEGRYKAISGPTQTGSIPFLGDRAAVAEYDQLKAILKLGIRSLLKGQGAVSDYEGKVLSDASSSLSRLTNEGQMKEALLKARGVLKTNQGLETEVIIKKDGKPIGKGMLNGEDIYQAVQDGNTIEYL